MVGFLLKKANLSTPHRPSTSAAIFLFVDAASLWRAEIVKASLPEVNLFTGNCFRMVRIVLKITFLGLRYPGQRPECPSLSYYGSWLAQFQFYNSSPIKYTGCHAQEKIGPIDINPSMKTAVSSTPGAKVT